MKPFRNEDQRKAMFANMKNQFYGARIGKDVEMIDKPTEPAAIRGMYRPEMPIGMTFERGYALSRPEAEEAGYLPRDIAQQYHKLARQERKRQSHEEAEKKLKKLKADEREIAGAKEMQRRSQVASNTAMQNLLDMGYTLSDGDLVATEEAELPASISPPDAFPIISVGAVKALLGRDAAYKRGRVDDVEPKKTKKKKRKKPKYNIKFTKEELSDVD